MDNMLEHPWIELQVLIKEKWLTQKAFSSILWKKVSEVNELLKWKRNITIQRDYLLHQTLWTPVKYWILKQIDYDYSLLNIEETERQDVILNNNEESISDITSLWMEPAPLSGVEIQENIEQIDSSADKSASEWQEKQQEAPTENSDSKDDEDLKNRANIFRTF